MWTTILKRNPIPKNKASWTTAIAGALSAGEEGVERITGIVSDAMKDDAKRTRQTVNIVRDLTQTSKDELGEKFSLSGENLENLVNGLENLLEKLSKIVVERPPLTIEHFNQAMDSLEENDTENLINFLGGGPKQWSGDRRPGRINRTQRIKMLKGKEGFIKEKTEGDVDLWYYDLSDNRITLPKGWEKQLETELEGLEDNYSLEGNVLTFPEKISIDNWKELKEPLSALMTNLNIETKLEVRSSPLIQVFPEREVGAAIGTRAEEIQSKKYVSTVTRDNILDYFQLTTRQGWPTKLLLPELPEEATGNKDSVLNTIYVNRNRLPPVVKMLLSSHNFDLSKMMDVGAATQETKFVPETIRAILVGGSDTVNEALRDDDNTQFKYPGIVRPGDTDLTLADIDGLSDKYREKALTNIEGRQKHYTNRFLSWLTSGSSEASILQPKYKILELRAKETRTLVVFSEEEAKSLWELSELKPFGDDEEEEIKLRSTLRELYTTKRVRRMEQSLILILEASDTFLDMFVPIKEQKVFKLNPDLRYKVSPTKITEFIKILQSFRQAQYQELDSEGDILGTDPIQIIQRVHKETGKDLDWNNEYNINIVTPQDILQALIYLDYWYGEMELNSLKNQYLDAYEDEAEDEVKDEALKTLISACEETFSELMDNITEKVKEKIDDIITNPDKYIEAMKTKSRKVKIYHLAGPLEDAGLIKEGETDDG